MDEKYEEEFDKVFEEKNDLIQKRKNEMTEVWTEINSRVDKKTNEQELKEVENDLKKINEEILKNSEEIKEIKDTFSERKKVQSEIEKLTKSQNDLLERKEECEEEIRDDGAGKEEARTDLEKINKELDNVQKSLINNFRLRKTLNKKIEEAIKKYGIEKRLEDKEKREKESKQQKGEEEKNGEQYESEENEEPRTMADLYNEKGEFIGTAGKQDDKDIEGLEENILKQTELEEQGEQQDEEKQDEERQDEEKKDEERQDEGKQDEERQDEGKQDEGKQDEGKQDEERQDEERQDEGKQDEENREDKTEKPGIVIARNVFVTKNQNFFEIGRIGKIFKKDKEDKVAKLKKIYSKGKLETLEEITEKVDPAIIEGVIELRKKNMLTEAQAQRSIIYLASGGATKDNLDFTIEYNMKDLSRGAFWPWNRTVRDQVVKVAEENRENGIAEFTDGVEYEPNPIKRMIARARQKKLGKGKEQEIEKNSEEKNLKASNVFKKRIKEETQKSDFEQLRDDILAGKSVEELETIVENAKDATRNGKISKTELQSLMNSAKATKTYIEKKSNEKQKEAGIEDPYVMDK